MNKNPTKENQHELRMSMKQLINELSSKFVDINEQLIDENVSIADVVFQSYDTKLTQIYFLFLRDVKSYENKEENKKITISRNIATREMVF